MVLIGYGTSIQLISSVKWNILMVLIGYGTSIQLGISGK